jgi:hypothetical protein
MKPETKPAARSSAHRIVMPCRPILRMRHPRYLLNRNWWGTSRWGNKAEWGTYYIVDFGCVTVGILRWQNDKGERP